MNSEKKLSFFNLTPDPFWPWKSGLGTIQSNQSVDKIIHTILWKAHDEKDKKLLNSFWQNGPRVQKRPNLTFDPWKMTLRTIQPNPSLDVSLMAPQWSSMPKTKKSYWSVSEILELKGKCWQTDRQTDGQTDGRTDDGQLGIRKAPLPDGKAELKNEQIKNNNTVTLPVITQ